MLSKFAALTLLVSLTGSALGAPLTILFSQARKPDFAAAIKTALEQAVAGAAAGQGAQPAASKAGPAVADAVSSSTSASSASAAEAASSTAADKTFSGGAADSSSTSTAAASATASATAASGNDLAASIETALEQALQGAQVAASSAAAAQQAAATAGADATSSAAGADATASESAGDDTIPFQFKRAAGCNQDVLKFATSTESALEKALHSVVGAANTAANSAAAAQPTVDTLPFQFKRDPDVQCNQDRTDLTASLKTAFDKSLQDSVNVANSGAAGNPQCNQDRVNFAASIRNFLGAALQGEVGAANSAATAAAAPPKADNPDFKRAVGSFRCNQDRVDFSTSMKTALRKTFTTAAAAVSPPGTVLPTFDGADSIATQFKRAALGSVQCNQDRLNIVAALGAAVNSVNAIDTTNPATAAVVTGAQASLLSAAAGTMSISLSLVAGQNPPASATEQVGKSFAAAQTALKAIDDPTIKASLADAQTKLSAAVKAGGAINAHCE
ncbi:hypothetical protein C8R47DRAFT_1064713 [Mycena vitilis]|nr:hypothetical protein C8R47DRAFT_1064713 [Mycena vitilis]